MSSIYRSIRNFICIAGLMLGASGVIATEVSSTGRAYPVQEGDVLEISVWKEEGLSREITVAPDGTLAFPLVGQVKAKGLSLAQLQTDLGTRLSAYIPQPSVSIILKSAAGSKIYVIGKVNRPGSFPLLGPVDVLQALSLAGGLTTFAEYNDIKIIRRTGGESRAIQFRYGDIEGGEKLDQNIPLENGDVVVVP